EAFHLGSPDAFDRLLDPIADGSSGICRLLREMTEPAPTGISTPTIHGYRIDDVLGIGGMGVVFAGEHLGTRRQVAIKVIRQATGHSDTLRHFRREVDILVRLRHPHIAVLHDAGTTTDGSPYFAMELIEGATLKDLMRSEGPVDLKTESGRNVIRRFVEICRAMNYAHQRGVIHRDLKPTNIMVAKDGAPKVLDFGLSRLIDPDTSTIVESSSPRFLAGTISYMSPEQATGPIGELDTRSDVYSLGVMLYELLTGRLPYTLTDVSIPAAIRAICESEPRRPAAIRPTTKGDLEAIALKAIEKSPGHRYQSAGDLADDLERALNGAPIEARPGRFYLLRRTIYRYRIQATVGAAFVAVLCISTGVSVWFWFKADRETEYARTVGKTAFVTVGHMMDEIHSSTRELGRSPALMMRIQSQLDRLSPLVESDPQVTAIRAELETMRGHLAYSQGDLTEARARLNAAIDMLPEDSPRSVTAHRILAGCFGTRNRMEHAEMAVRNANRDLDRCNALFAKADVLLDMQRGQDALRVLNEVDCETLRNDLLFRKALIQNSLEDYAGSIETMKAAIVADEANIEAFPLEIKYRSHLAIAHANLAKSLMFSHRNDEALDHARKAIDVAEHVLWIDPYDLTTLSAITFACEYQVTALLEHGKLDDAESSLRKLEHWTQRLVASDPGGTRWLTTRAEFQLCAGRVHHAKGDDDKAEEVWKAALDNIIELEKDIDQELPTCLNIDSMLCLELSMLAAERRDDEGLLRYQGRRVSAFIRLAKLSPNTLFEQGNIVASALNLSAAFCYVGRPN
ncbi:MAG TPA: protein kinase, partial [Phycisphaerae bacterium]|nr:protein kinase [Phycisphaerae bacterium]